MTATVVCPECDAYAASLRAAGADGLAGLRVPPELDASVPPPRRDAVRLLVGRGDGGDGGDGEVSHHGFRDLPDLLRAGDVLVVNTSRTLPAAVDGRLAGKPVVVHCSTRRDDGRWVVEVRMPDGRGSTVRTRWGSADGMPGADPLGTASPVGAVVELTGGTRLVLDEPADPAGDRLWVATPSTADLVPELYRFGRPIRYAYTERDQPLAAYQTVFATAADGRSGRALRIGAGGSAEMPSAGRPFTAPLVTALVSRGVQIAPIVLHTGVASAEAHEGPQAEPYEVSASTAWQVNAARAAGGRIIAVGTTAVRALETAADERGTVAARRGWTDLVITPERGIRAVDGLLTGLHEPEASHLLMLRALSGDATLARVYGEALQHRYLWHEFGDVNLLLR